MPEPTANRATAGGNAESTALSATLNADVLSSLYACAMVCGRRMKNAALRVAASTSMKTARGESIHVEYCTWEKKIEMNESVRHL